MKVLSPFAHVVLLAALGLNFTVAQTRSSAAVFGPALEEIRTRTPIAILLPPRLPSSIIEKDIKLASGSVSKDGYFISLYFGESGSNANYAAGFGGSTFVIRDLPNARKVRLAGGHHWNVQAGFLWGLLRAREPMVGAGWRHVPDTDQVRE